MLYLHVPFCQSRCIYCDFYSTTRDGAERAAYAEALCEEIRERRDYLPDNRLKTIYFGGGTPSQLPERQIGKIMECVRSTFTIIPGAELTFEANPDDITPGFASFLHTLGFNRVSLGVQTFHDTLLRLLNRRHTAEEARKAVVALVENGIKNVSIDLIYGLPRQTCEMFLQDLDTAFSLPVTHLSAYSLMVGEGTPLHHMVRSGRLTPAGEELCIREYGLLMDTAAANGWEHYEISNFAKPGFHSRHNSAYWDGTPYLGCGPGAHSYNGDSRRRNLPDLDAYLNAHGNPPHETETLSDDEKYDEMAFTALRTSKGLRLDDVENIFGKEIMKHTLSTAAAHISNGTLSLDRGTLRLTRKGLFVSDGIMSDFMLAWQSYDKA